VNVISLCANPCGEACYKIADTESIHIDSDVDGRKGQQFTGNQRRRVDLDM
jgi:hypothetical protein